MFPSTLEELNQKSSFFLGASGYEPRASALAPFISTGVEHRHVLGFHEHNDHPARLKNDETYQRLGFNLRQAQGNSSIEIRDLVNAGVGVAKSEKKALAFDISSMTRVWQGAIVQTLMETNWQGELETFIAYVPSRFEPPPRHVPPNEFVGPLPGFGSLSPPDLPIALVLSLGYERERALGFMEILDPGRTVLMIAKGGKKDPFYQTVLQNNRDILARISSDCLFEYPLLEPVAAFRYLESICGGLEWSYRIVLASLGPKLFGVLCLLLAARNRTVSVWRMTPGVHGQPRDIRADLEKKVVFKVVWTPETDKFTEPRESS